MGLSQRLFNLFPEISISNDRVLRNLYKAGDYLGRPMENRFIMGATAICTQPYIDSRNKNVDEDTARSSKNRTIAKIVAGTLVGCIVRGGIYFVISKLTKTSKKNAWDQLLMPTIAADLLKHKDPITVKKTENSLKNHVTGISTILAMIVMIGTNILFDLPLTNKISNYLNQRDARKRNKKLNVKQNIEHSNPTNMIKNKFANLKGGQS